MTPLGLAIRRDHAPVARLLLDYNAALESVASELPSPLILCVSYNRIDIAKLLLDKGAAVCGGKACTRRGTPLLAAAR